MSDNPGAAASMFPDLAHDAAVAPAPSAPASDAARALFGEDGKKIARPVDGVSALGGQARRETEPEPARQQQPATRAEPFNPAKLQIEGLQPDAGLMNEFSTAAKELGLDHAGATRLVELHTKVQKQADAAMDRQADQWQRETLAAIPQHELNAVKNLVRDPSLTDPQLAQWLATSPAGDWLPLVKTLVNWSRAMNRRY